MQQVSLGQQSPRVPEGAFGTLGQISPKGLLLQLGGFPHHWCPPAPPASTTDTIWSQRLEAGSTIKALEMAPNHPWNSWATRGVCWGPHRQHLPSEVSRLATSLSCFKSHLFKKKKKNMSSKFLLCSFSESWAEGVSAAENSENYVCILSSTTSVMGQSAAVQNG